MMKHQEKQLVHLFKRMNGPQRQMLLDLAHQLLKCNQNPLDAKPHTQFDLSLDAVSEPLIEAINRLTDAYLKMDGRDLLAPLSEMVRAQAVGERSVEDAISELEALFERRLQAEDPDSF